MAFWTSPGSDNDAGGFAPSVNLSPREERKSRNSGEKTGEEGENDGDLDFRTTITFNANLNTTPTWNNVKECMFTRITIGFGRCKPNGISVA